MIGRNRYSGTITKGIFKSIYTTWWCISIFEEKIEIKFKIIDYSKSITCTCILKTKYYLMYIV